MDSFKQIKKSACVCGVGAGGGTYMGIVYVEREKEKRAEE